MAILFVGNTPQDVGLPASVLSTDATGRDAAYSPYSLKCKSQNPSIPIPVSSGTDFWIHFRWNLNSTDIGNSVVSATVYQLYDENGNVIFDIIKAATNQNMNIRVYGSTTVSSPVYIFRNLVDVVWDFKVTVGASGGNISVDWYINGSYFSTTTAVNSGTVKTQPRIFNMNHPSNIASAAFVHFTEIIVAVDEPTIGMRLATLNPTTAGAFSAWTGTVASLADSDSASGIQVTSNGQRFSSIFSAYAGPSNPAGVRGLYLKGVGSQSGGAPTKIDQFLRISSMNYDGTPITPSVGVPFMREYTTNPATSAPWLVSAFAALEAGFLSAT